MGKDVTIERTSLSLRVRRYLSTFTATVIITVGLSQSAAKANVAQPVKPQYATSYCVNAIGAVNWDKVNLPNNCSSNIYQLWYTQPSSYQGGGWEELVNYASGKCLQDGNNGGSGTDLTVYTCNGSESQAVTPGPYSSWDFAAHGLCVNGIADVDVTAYTCNDSHAQSWVW